MQLITPHYLFFEEHTLPSLDYFTALTGRTVDDRIKAVLVCGFICKAVARQCQMQILKSFFTAE
jgi:hypothetical protein